MPSRRQRRVAELIHEQISTLIQFELKDPRIGFVTVTDTEVTPDLRLATVYVSLLSGDERMAEEMLAGLDSATPFLRHELGQRIRLRYVPELRFKLDQSQAYAERINTLLSQIDIPPEPDDEAEEDDRAA